MKTTRLGFPARSVVLLLAVVAAGAAVRATASELIDRRAANGTVWYEKFEGESKVGWMKIVFAAARQGGRDVLETRSVSKMEMDRDSVTVKYDATDLSVFDENIHLLSFETVLKIEGRPVTLTGKRDDAGFHLVVKDGERESKIDFPKADYDYITADEVYRLLKHPGDERSWRMLDLESFTIVPVNYRYERNETCPSPREDKSCIVLYYRKGKDLSNAWVEEESGVLVRQRGIGDAGPYEIRLSDSAAAEAEGKR